MTPKIFLAGGLRSGIAAFRCGIHFPAKAFSKPTDIRRTTKSVGRGWYTLLVGLMPEDNFSKRCS